MKIFKKLPIEVEAHQFVDNTSAQEILDWFEAGRYGKRHSMRVLSDRRGEDNEPRVRGLLIETLEGDMRVDLNDWVIEGINGEFYPCKPEIFQATYEEVTE